MGVLGAVFDGVVGVLRTLGLGLAMILGFILWKAPNGMLPETKFVLLTVIFAVIYDDVVLGEQDFGAGDLVITSGVAFGATVVLN